MHSLIFPKTCFQKLQPIFGYIHHYTLWVVLRFGILQKHCFFSSRHESEIRSILLNLFVCTLPFYQPGSESHSRSQNMYFPIFEHILLKFWNLSYIKIYILILKHFGSSHVCQYFLQSLTCPPPPGRNLLVICSKTSASTSSIFFV